MAKDNKAQQVVDQISDFVNSMSHDADAFIQAMNCEHRTLQQSFGRLVFKWIEAQSKKESGQYDLRNEAMVKLCKEIVDNVEDFDAKKHLPFI